MNFKKLSLIGFVSIALFSCEKTETEPTQPYDSGVIVVNAGNFFDNNGTLSLVDRNSRTASLDIFQKENSRPITGGISDYAEVDGKGIILVDNATTGQDKIEIVNARTLKSVATIPSSEIENPRQVVKAGTDKAYITAWAATGAYTDFYTNKGYVAVLDLKTNKITKKITVQKGAESIVIVGNEAFVGDVNDGVVQVIDTQTDTFKQEIKGVGSVSSLQADANGKLWGFVYQDAIRINPQTKQVEAKIRVGNHPDKTPGSLAFSADKKTIYFAYTFYDPADNYLQKGEVYSFNINDTTIPATTPVSKKVVSGLGFDATSNLLYAGVTPSYKQAGFVYRYQPNGTLVDSVKVEIAPAKFIFK
ncbi:DUF5074 domain-containing protein [Emticicia sp. 17c]|uniref:DUF5074 domain-containing protein n=1 Tax=Emticicia sp. 17c TaxID=3127704 RepID=UPI00301E4979